jgi:hypothetical protein
MREGGQVGMELSLRDEPDRDQTAWINGMDQRHGSTDED